MSCQSILSYETWVHAAAGAMGSIFAMTAFYPLDTIRFRQQLEDKSKSKDQNVIQVIYDIIKTEGLGALYRGIKPVLISLGASNFVYFYTFHGLKSISNGSTTSDLLLSMTSGVINVLVTAPLWVVNSRLKVAKQTYFTGLLDGLAHIASTEGLTALWAGLGPSLILVLNPAIQFTIYEALKRNMSAKTAMAFFLMGAASKAAATVATYPLQLAQTRQRYGKDGKIGMAALLLAILKRGGPSALFNGLEAKLLQTVLTAALMFVTYEKIVQYVFLILMKRVNKK